LHIRRVEGGSFSESVLARLKIDDRLRIELPFGDFYLREDVDRPIVFIASGAGFAPVKSMVERLIRSGSKRPVRFYWSGRASTDLYARELAEKWASRLPWFEFTPILTVPEPSWRGRKGLVHRAVLEDVPDLSTYQVYACGNPVMIRKARMDFLAQGRMLQEQFFAEPFVITGN
jgi:NAD(P)H-flavin reductase